ncbi:MAG: nicotinate-nucleotide adenylyltransferase [Acidobacteriia bacterium]|nr:nicotinate-nucleotide adenylyltransferase [Terriglobia bacterium]
MRLALFGGTFDPIHQAHLEIAGRAADRFHLDRILFVPAARPPHKAGVTHASYEHRVRMIEIACQGNPRLALSRLEEGTERSYSIDTIEKVRAEMAPAGELFFLIGADAFAEIRTWRRWRDVAAAVRFLVVSRPGHVYETPPEVRLERLDNLELPVSSSHIRQALATGGRPAEVPPRVLDYIVEHALYGARVPA